MMPDKHTFVYCFIFFVIFVLFLPPSIQYYFYQKAYADGLTQENLPPASVGNRQASLFVKVNPPILTTDNRQNAYMQFRLFDANNNQTIQHVTYEITVSRGTSSSSSNEKPLMRDFFHAHNGLLTLKIQPTPGAVTVYGEQDPFQNAWVADPGGTINVKGPVLLEGGLYHFHVEIFAIDNDRNIFIPENAPKFDSYLSVGDIYRNNWNYQNHNYNTTLVSYYDKIINNKINFDPIKKSFSWSMPFNWNLTRLQQQPIFVHEEMRLPKSWKGFGDSTRFNATVNGQPLSGRSLAIDPFSYPNAMVVHYLVNKNDVLKLAAQQQQAVVKKTSNSNSNTPTSGAVSSNVKASSSSSSSNSSGVMRFNLLSPSATSKIETSSDLVTNTGGIHAAVSWAPNPLMPKTQSTIKISFYDPVTSNPLSSNDIRYDMTILDKNSHAIIAKPNLLAKNAVDTQTITFPAKDIYQIQLQIKGLQKTGQTTDLTRNGIAKGYVVVPEFPSSSATIFLIGGLFGALLIIQRSRKRRIT
ncbi:MAG TPA: hypothetical protein VFJ51_00700 [Nitrososphaeraceae archaeon]|nr:hypothetical protein [Nitrososphaeraceae archaeon]